MFVGSGSIPQTLGGVGIGSGHHKHSHVQKKFQKKKINEADYFPTFVLINYIMETMTIQKLEKSSSNRLELAQQYYALISALNNLYLTEREIQLIAFSAVRGSVSFATVREDFCTIYKSSFPTINNMVSKLKTKGILIKQGKQIVVNPRIALDFSKPLILQITLTVNNEQRETNEHASEGVAHKKTESEVEHT